MKNAEQIAFWNGDVGATWVAHNALMEAMLAPLGERVMDTLTLSADTRALDVGCGCGQPSLSLAQRIGPGGTVTGIDISAPMLALAAAIRSRRQRRGPGAEADAQIHAFELIPLTWSSRFGVMFLTPSRRLPAYGGDVFTGNTGFLLLATAGSQSVYDSARNGRPGASAAPAGATQITRALRL